MSYSPVFSCLTSANLIVFLPSTKHGTPLNYEVLPPIQRRCWAVLPFVLPLSIFVV